MTGVTLAAKLWEHLSHALHNEREAIEMVRHLCLVRNDQHVPVPAQLDRSVPDMLEAAADHFHEAQTDLLLDRAAMAHLHMREACCRELLSLLLH